jgi:hypothetical protein
MFSLNKDIWPHLSQLLQVMDYGYLILTSGHVVWTQCLARAMPILSEMNTAGPPKQFRSFNIATTVINEEKLAEIIHSYLLHSLTRKVRQTGGKTY